MSASTFIKSSAGSVYPILIVDQDHSSQSSMESALRKIGLEKILLCSDSQQVLKMITQYSIRMVFLEFTLSQTHEESLLDSLSEHHPELPVIVLSDTEDLDITVQCIKAGAFNYLKKPIDFNRLLNIVKDALALQQTQSNFLMTGTTDALPELRRPEAFARIITRNTVMLQAFQYLESIADTSEPVLITGETGVGKDLMAQAIHTLSNRRGALIAINIGGLDDAVFSDTLFGHIRGAFTSADRTRAGLIEQAAGGTLFLDEIGDLTPASQAKLLRLLQGGDYFPLGSDTPHHSDARVVSATNRDLWRLTKKKKFREDLNFRLRAHHLHVPPLRERLGDLPLLIDHFLQEAANRLSRPQLQASEALLKLLEEYDFPGNIRELRMMVFDAASRSTSVVLSPALFEPYLRHGLAERAGMPGAADHDAALLRFTAKLPTLKQATDLLVQEALRRTGGNQTAAARLLGVSQQALSKRLKLKEEDGA